MNICKKLFCRVYQFAFHLALPVLPYREPEILSTNEEIATVIKNKNMKSALLITDSFLRQSGLTKSLEEALDDCGIKCVVYDRTRANPTVENVEEALELYNGENCECIIAFGGGSAMDCAKATGARVVYPKRNLDKLKGDLRIFKRLPDLFAVPTTAGTGSEVTVTAVITDAKKSTNIL